MSHILEQNVALTNKTGIVMTKHQLYHTGPMIHFLEPLYNVKKKKLWVKRPIPIKLNYDVFFNNNDCIIALKLYP